MMIPYWAICIRRFRDVGIAWYWLPVVAGIVLALTASVNTFGLKTLYTPANILVAICGVALFFILGSPSNFVKRADSPKRDD
ncbi:hypothetical protein [Lapidilactobacillus concavus]|uniref:hypothetical protein n=1 Tax=Lapidilactobacillus concavus TaxID=287844 RepID=UPI000A71D7FE|nr:hypothetical protein [Lapidilactobacillus concavus]